LPIKTPSKHAFTTLDQGIERGKQLQANQPQWNQGKRRIHAYTSEIDGAVLPYGVTLPDNYDPSKPTRLYVWLHGRQNTTTETEFIYGVLNRRGAGNPPVAGPGTNPTRLLWTHQWRGLALAGEADVFESIAAGENAFQHRRQAHHDPRLLAGREGAWPTFRCIIRIDSLLRKLARELFLAPGNDKTSPAINERPSASGKYLRMGAQHP